MRHTTVLLLLAAILFCSCSEEGLDSSGGVEAEGQQDQTALRSVTATPDGFLDLRVIGGSGVFEFRLRVPTDTITAGTELDPQATPLMELSFTGLVPIEDQAVSDAMFDEVECWVQTDESGEEFDACFVPYVGYGTDTPTTIAIGEASSEVSLVRVFFHEFGTEPGDTILMEYLLMHVYKYGNQCLLFYDFSRQPVEFQVGEEMVVPATEIMNNGWALGGPVFPSDTITPADGACTLDLFPILYEDFCPMSMSTHSVSFPSSGSHWYDRCKQDFPELPGYPND